MKKRKFKLLASLTSLVLVIAVMAVGVWAAISQTVSVSTTVTFNATGMDGSISATLTGLEGGTKYYNSTGTDAGAPLTFKPSSAADLAPWTITEETAIGSSDGLANSLVYSFTVTNNSTTNAMLLTVTDVEFGGVEITAGGDAVNNMKFTSTSETLSKTDNVLTGTISANTGEGTGTSTFTMTFDVDDDALSIAATAITFTVTLTAAN